VTSLFGLYHQHTTLRREGVMSDMNRIQTVKELLGVSAWKGFSSLGVLLREILPFKYCKISGWQKR